MPYLQTLENYLATYPLQKGVGGFLILDGVVSVADGLMHADGLKAQGSRIARMAAGAAYEFLYALPNASKALGAYMVIDGTVSLAFESIASGREQAHLRYLRAARIGVGLLTFLFL